MSQWFQASNILRISHFAQGPGTVPVYAALSDADACCSVDGLIASAGSMAHNRGDALVKFKVSAVGHVTPYVLQNACSDKSCCYGARLHTSQNMLELAKRSNNWTAIHASVPFMPRANTFYWMRLDVLPGTSDTIRAKVWPDGAPEPASWIVTAVDGSPLAANLAGTGGR